MCFFCFLLDKCVRSNQSVSSFISTNSTQLNNKNQGFNSGQQTWTTLYNDVCDSNVHFVGRLSNFQTSRLDRKENTLRQLTEEKNFYRQSNNSWLCPSVDFVHQAILGLQSERSIPSGRSRRHLLIVLSAQMTLGLSFLESEKRFKQKCVFFVLLSTRVCRSNSRSWQLSPLHKKRWDWLDSRPIWVKTCDAPRKPEWLGCAPTRQVHPDHSTTITFMIAVMVCVCVCVCRMDRRKAKGTRWMPFLAKHPLDTNRSFTAFVALIRTWRRLMSSHVNHDKRVPFCCHCGRVCVSTNANKSGIV